MATTDVPFQWEQRKNKDGTMARAYIRDHGDGVATLKFNIDNVNLFRFCLDEVKGMIPMTFNRETRWQEFDSDHMNLVTSRCVAILGTDNVVVMTQESLPGVQSSPVAAREPRMATTPAMSIDDAYTALCLRPCAGPATVEAAFREAVMAATDGDVIQRLGAAYNILRPKVKGRLRKP